MGLALGLESDLTIFMHKANIWVNDIDFKKTAILIYSRF